MIDVERVQTGIRIEKRLLKVLKGVAEMRDLSLADLIEGICLHAIEGSLPFGKETLATARTLRSVYGLDLTAADAHRLVEAEVKPATGRVKTLPATAKRLAAKKAAAKKR